MNSLESEEFNDEDHLTEAMYAKQKNLDKFDFYFAGKQEHLSENAESIGMAIAT